MNRLGPRLALAWCAVLVIGAGLAQADVVPARKAKVERDAAKLEARLVDLGIDAATARGSADRLTPAELRFFAEDSDRVQAVGGLTGTEWLGGVVFLGILGGMYFAFISDQE